MLFKDDIRSARNLVDAQSFTLVISAALQTGLIGFIKIIHETVWQSTRNG